MFQNPEVVERPSAATVAAAAPLVIGLQARFVCKA
jgi:hypothetical protein